MRGGLLLPAECLAGQSEVFHPIAEEAPVHHLQRVQEDLADRKDDEKGEEGKGEELAEGHRVENPVPSGSAEEPIKQFHFVLWLSHGSGCLLCHTR